MTPDASPSPRLFLPKESGAWGTLTETILAGCLAAWSAATGLVALALVALFFVRQPVRLVLGRLLRGRTLPRPGLVAALIASWMLAAAAGLILATAAAGTGLLAGFIPVAILGSWQLVLDVRGRGRELAPELAGAVGMAGCVLALALAGGRGWQAGLVLWLLLAARQATAILFVRTWLRRSRGKAASLAPPLTVLAVAVAIAGWAGVTGRLGWLAGVAPLAIVLRVGLALPRLSRPVVPSRLGLQELTLGIVFAVLIGLGV